MKKYIVRITCCIVLGLITIAGINAKYNAKAFISEIADRKIPSLYITIDPKEYEKVIESEDHTYSVEDASVRIEVPEGYKNQYGEIDTDCIDTELELDIFRGRGNSTWLMDKKPFKLKLEKKADLLGMGKAKKWNLLANAYDSSLLRNRIMYEIGRKYGLNYTPKMLSVDLYINDECMGNYILSQSIDVNESMVDIDKISPEEKDEQKITGGYLLSMNPSPDELPENILTTEHGISFLLKEPAFDDINDKDKAGLKKQREYITEYLQKTENAIFGENQKDENGVSWTEYMDMESTAKYWWIQQICENADAYRTDSTFLYKEKDGKLYWGPLWDFDIALDPPTYDGGFNYIPVTWLDYLRANDQDFRKELENTWRELEPILDEMTEEGGYIDKYAEEIRDSWERDNLIWHKESNRECSGLDTQITVLKQYIDRKKESIDKNLDLLGDVNVAVPATAKNNKTSEEENISTAYVKKEDIAGGVSGTCYWRIDKNGHMTIGPLEGSEGTLGTWDNAPDRPWHLYTQSVTKVSFEGKVHAKTCLAMFYHCYNLKEIDLTGLDTSSVEMMRGMFAWCWTLEKLKLSEMDTSNATSMREMFLACKDLKSVDLSNLNLSNIKDVRSLFYRCYNLQSVTLPENGVESIEKMSGMFADCFELEKINLSGLDTSNVTNMRALFYRCYKLKEANLSGMNTAKVNAMDYMFAECGALTQLDLESFDTKNVTDSSNMFLGCPLLKKIKTGKQWNLS